MLAYFSDEPVIRTMSGDQNGLVYYTVTAATGMQNDTILSGQTAFTNSAFCPDGHEDLEIGSLLRSMISEQERNIKTLQHLNSQGCSITQGTFTFNSYFTVSDSSGGTSDDYSIIYDTRGITAPESGCTYIHQPGSGYVANYFPETEIMQGQYFSLMWRMPSNALETASYIFGFEYTYTVSGPPSYNVLERNQIQTVTGQSFRYSGTADWQEWGEGNSAQRGRFYLYNEKEGYVYLTPWLYPKFCDDPDTVYLYWVNSMGGIDFKRGVMTKSLNHEDSTYEANVGIDERLDFRSRIYHQTKWNSYMFNTSLISDDDSPSIADICGARWAWLYIPGDTPMWRSVKVTDTKATVKTYRNQGAKLYNYAFELEDATKYKSV